MITCSCSAWVTNGWGCFVLVRIRIVSYMSSTRVERMLPGIVHVSSVLSLIYILASLLLLQKYYFKRKEGTIFIKMMILYYQILDNIIIYCITINVATYNVMLQICSFVGLNCKELSLSSRSAFAGRVLISAFTLSLLDIARTKSKYE